MATNASTLKLFLLAGLMAAGVLLSCDKVEERLDDLEHRVSNLETVSDWIQQVIRENKIISEVREESDSYILSFTDGTSLTIDNSGGELVSIQINQNTVVITLADGQSYTLPLVNTSLTGIVLATTRPAKLGLGATTVVPFRINPSNAGFDVKDLTLETDCSYFALEEVRQTEAEGEYEAVLRDLSVSSDYDEDAYFAAKGIRSNAFRVMSNSIYGLNTGLPVVVLDTPDAAPIVSKEVWLEGATVTIYNPDGSIDYEGSLSVKGRGNSTWTQFPKKPYAMKLDSKGEILGMKKHKRWCLLANWMDRTLIRNAVAFEISRKTELAWTPSGKFVELILNGEHKGNYYLCEQVKVDENRVNITELKKTSVEGGYLMEVDAWFDEAYKFRSPVHDVPWQFKDPDEVNQAQFDYMYAYVEAFERSLYDDALFKARDYTNYIDCDSWVDWWLVNELAQNGDVNQPKSIYISKDVGGKLVAGPVWDFDWGTFIPVEFNPSMDKVNYSCRGPKFYLNRICIEDPQFRALAKEHWMRFRSALAEIPAYIDSLAATLVASDAINIAMWPIDRTTNQDVTLSYMDAVARLKQAYTEKFQWLDNIIINTY